jgi:hypothetical protein
VILRYSFSDPTVGAYSSRRTAAAILPTRSGSTAGLVSDLGGPRVYEMAELVRSYLQARGMRRPILPIRLPGTAPRVPSRCESRPAPGCEPPDLEDFLAARTRSPMGQHINGTSRQAHLEGIA